MPLRVFETLLSIFFFSFAAGAELSGDFFFFGCPSRLFSTDGCLDQKNHGSGKQAEKKGFEYRIGEGE